MNGIYTSKRYTSPTEAAQALARVVVVAELAGALVRRASVDQIHCYAYCPAVALEPTYDRCELLDCLLVAAIADAGDCIACSELIESNPDFYYGCQDYDPRPVADELVSIWLIREAKIVQSLTKKLVSGNAFDREMLLHGMTLLGKPLQSVEEFEQQVRRYASHREYERRESDQRRTR